MVDVEKQGRFWYGERYRPSLYGLQVSRSNWMSIFIIFLSFLDRQTRVNSVDPHQATRGSVLSGSVLFVILSASSGKIFLIVRCTVIIINPFWHCNHLITLIHLSYPQTHYRFL